MKPVIALTENEFRALLEKTREHDHRAYLMFLVTVLHGLRVSELIVGSFLFFGTIAVATAQGANEAKQTVPNQHP